MLHGNSFNNKELDDFQQADDSGIGFFQVLTKLGISQAGYYRRRQALKRREEMRLAVKMAAEAAKVTPPWVTESPAPAQPEPTEAEKRRETRDAQFWKKRAGDLEKALSDAEHFAEQVGGVRDMPVDLPKWSPPGEVGERDHKAAVLGLFISDAHIGEVVHADQIMGLNGYNVATAIARLRRLTHATIDIGPRWAADCSLRGIVVFSGGDNISGDIREETRINNELTSHEQVRVWVAEMTVALRSLADKFGLVHFVQVPGNHGRTTLKPVASNYAQTNYDTLSATMIRDRLQDDPRFSFHISPSIDAIVPVLGYRFFITHGDRIGTGGGQGFIGPIAPIVRGGNKVALQQNRAHRNYDYLLTGHFHHSSNPGNHFANGSVAGYNEYANGLRASLEPPQQWLFLVHQKWGVRERMPINLGDAIGPIKQGLEIHNELAVA